MTQLNGVLNDSFRRNQCCHVNVYKYYNLNYKVGSSGFMKRLRLVMKGVNQTHTFTERKRGIQRHQIHTDDQKHKH